MSSWLRHMVAALQAEAGRQMVRMVAGRLATALGGAGTLSLPDVARRLGVHRVTVWGWVKRGWLPAIRVGHHYRVPRDIVEAMLAPVDVVTGPGGHWRCPVPECPAVYATAAALAAHLVLAHQKEGEAVQEGGGMRYLLNSAVITGPGLYEYRLVATEEAAEWIRRGGWVSRIGYPQTADHIERLSGVRPALSREASPMEAGDEALVVRLKYRVTDPGQKGAVPIGPEDWEYGILRRLR